MALETGEFIADLVQTNPDGLDGKADGDNHLRLIKKILKNTFGGLSRALWGVRSISSNITLAASDIYTTIVANPSANITITVPAMGTLPTEFRFEVLNISAFNVTVLMSNSELVNGAASDTVYPNEKWVYSKVGAALYRPIIFRRGMIMMHNGATIPAGWALCNGANETPDLRDKFVIGAGNNYARGAAGGSADAVVVSHSHGITDPGHIHNFRADVPFSTVNDPANAPVNLIMGDPSTTAGQLPSSTLLNRQYIAGAGSNISVNSSGVSGDNANLPPYIAFYYIMKL